MTIATSFSRSRVFAAAIAILAATTLTGCGLGPAATSAPATVPGPAIFGTVMGGASPIVGATIKIYATGDSTGASAGYGVGTLLQEANQVGASPGQDTDNRGNFGFAGGYNCPAGQFVYVVSTSGNPGGATANDGAVLVDALGRCEDLYAYNSTTGTYTGYVGARINIDEITTVAAAYALGSFTTITGTGAGTVVSIGAPATNNASVGCIANGTTCPVTAAAGLRHAFQNAIDLVNPNTHTANSTLAGNTAAIVPNELINSLGNSMVACVNTNGGSSATACNILFTNTAEGGVTPTNTLQAMINIAHDPALASTSNGVASIFYIQTPQTTVYYPFLNTAPTDFSVAITYPQGTGASAGVQGLQYPYSAALDINDNLYIGNNDAATPTKFNLFSFTSSGSIGSFTADAAGTSPAAGASTDALGNAYLLDSVANTISRYAVDRTTAAITSMPTSISTGGSSPAVSAVDRFNNLWFATSASTVAELPATATATTFSASLASPAGGIAVDPNQNIWATDSSATGANYVTIVQNTGTAAAPAYSASSLLTTSALSGEGAAAIAFVDNTAAGIATQPFVGYVTNTTSASGITPVTPTLTGAEVTSATPGTHNTAAAFTQANALQADGAGTLWIANGTGNNLLSFVPGATSPLAYKPCRQNSTTANSVCASTPLSAVRSVAVDSTGSVWVLSPGTGSIAQVIGIAAPTWPLLSLGRLGRP